MKGIHSAGCVIGKGEKKRKFIILGEELRKELYQIVFEEMKEKDWSEYIFPS